MSNDMIDIDRKALKCMIEEHTKGCGDAEKIGRKILDLFDSRVQLPEKKTALVASIAVHLIDLERYMSAHPSLPVSVEDHAITMYEWYCSEEQGTE